MTAIHLNVGKISCNVFQTVDDIQPKCDIKCQAVANH